MEDKKLTAANGALLRTIRTYKQWGHVARWYYKTLGSLRS